MNVISSFYSVSFIEHLVVAMNQKRKPKFRGWGTAVPSPEPLWGTDAGATVCRDTLPDGRSSPGSPSGSAGPEGSLSLDTPRKKGKVLNESVLHDHKDKLKVSRKGSQISASSQVSLQTEVGHNVQVEQLSWFFLGRFPDATRFLLQVCGSGLCVWRDRRSTRGLCRRTRSRPP